MSLSSLNVHGVVSAEAKPTRVNDAHWLSIRLEDDAGARFDLAFFTEDPEALHRQIAGPLDGYTEGVNAAAAMLDKMADDFAADNSVVDPETGVAEFGRNGDGEDYYNTLRELADDIRTLIRGLTPVAA